MCVHRVLCFAIYRKKLGTSGVAQGWLSQRTSRAGRHMMRSKCLTWLMFDFSKPCWKTRSAEPRCSSQEFQCMLQPHVTNVHRNWAARNTQKKNRGLGQPYHSKHLNLPHLKQAELLAGQKETWENQAGYSLFQEVS